MSRKRTLRTLAELRAEFPRPGRVDWIGLRAARKSTVQSVSSAYLAETGLEGDHSRSGKRALTLIQAEHLPVISALTAAEVTPERLRRNILVSGLNLLALRGWTLSIGAAKVELTTLCAPCSRMEDTLGQGGYNAMRGHGGFCARVVEPGEIRLGDPLLPLCQSA